MHYLGLAIADAVEAHYTLVMNALNEYQDDSGVFGNVWAVYSNLKAEAEYAAEDALVAAINAQYGAEAA